MKIKAALRQPLMVIYMSDFICPVCKGRLTLSSRVYRCENNHAFDVAKEGYVNLLMSQKSSLKRHGDDKLMVRARRDFLEKDFYKPLSDELCRCIGERFDTNATLVDVGCGEGYYTKAVCDNTGLQIYGIDVSKDALKFAAKNISNGEFCVASAFDLPLGDKSVDCILNVFAPSAYGEFYRVLKDKGLLIKAVPLADHLWELKCALYKEPYKNKPEKRDDELFQLVFSQELKYKITLNDQNDIGNLFKMTPYYYKTGREDAQRLLSLKALETTVHFGLEVYEKR